MCHLVKLLELISSQYCNSKYPSNSFYFEYNITHHWIELWINDIHYNTFITININFFFQPGVVGSRNETKPDPRRTSGGQNKDGKRTESRSKRESGVQSPNRGSSSMSGNKNEDNLDGSASIDGSSIEKPSQRLQRFRWIIPQNGHAIIRLRFTSEEIGQFDQTLNFEILGTRRRYQLHCRGVCTFPTISREPRWDSDSKNHLKLCWKYN